MKKAISILVVLLSFIFTTTVYAGNVPAVSVQAIDVPSIAKTGSNFTIVVTIVGSGTKTKIVKATVKFYLTSGKKKISIGSKKVTMDESTWSGGIVRKIPKKTKEGTYYLLVCVGKVCVASTTQIQVVKVLPPPPPPPLSPPVQMCTDYTYTEWSACDPSGHQNRTTIGYLPAGCTGAPSTAPVLTQSCTPPSPPSPLFKMDGETKRTAVDETGNLFTIITTTSGLDSLVKSDKNGETFWETSMGCNRSNIALLGTNAYVICKKGTGVFVEVVDQSTGQPKTELETKIASNGEPFTIIADPSASSLYLMWVDYNSGSTMPWMARANSDVNQTSGFVNGPFDGNIAVGATGVYISRYTGEWDVVVDRHAKDLSAKTNIVSLINVGELSGITLSGDEKELFITDRGNFMARAVGDPPTRNALFVVDITSGGINTIDAGLAYGNGPSDLSYDPFGLYSIVQTADGYSIIKIDPATGKITPIVTNISGGGGDHRPLLTTDTASGRFYVSHLANQPDTVCVWDLGGNPL
ncbi:MAG: beta-propeller fold lactonase family protein [Candidatus Pacebacteria bacterium]|nr:beta-propeller fold lactonase family protein [Candidatus Paceibacterota bacterium]